MYFRKRIKFISHEDFRNNINFGRLAKMFLLFEFSRSQSIEMPLQNPNCNLLMHDRKIGSSTVLEKHWKLEIVT